MFGRHFLAMALVVIGIAIGVIIAVEYSWQKGLVVGVIIVAGASLFAIANMYFSSRRFW